VYGPLLQRPHETALDRYAVPHRGDRILEPRRPVDDEKLGPPQATPDEIVEHRPPGLALLSPPMLLTASNAFWPSTRTPMTTSSEIAVALRSSRTRITVPSRMSHTIGSSANERASHASQSLFTLRHTRLTVSLPTAPWKQRAQRPPHPARVGAGQVAASDQRVGRQQSENETAEYVFDSWFDSIEAGLRDRAREFLQAMFEAELDEVLARSRYARRGSRRLAMRRRWASEVTVKDEGVEEPNPGTYSAARW
jgi:hypothetical protein